MMAPGKALLAALTIAISAGTNARAGEATAQNITPPISTRFAAATQEVPDFQRHVVPLLGRVGCNGRACHGSFQGRGGFRLSLFGYDFEMDHTNLAKGDDPRVNVKSSKESLILRKPTLTEPHEGGKRFEADSWQYRVLERWIEGGAAQRAEKHADLVHLHVQPAEILFRSPDEKVQLQITAEWSDGTREDVTPLSRFQTNNDDIAKIDAAGLVSAGAQGDTHVVVFYDNGVVPVPVLRPVSRPKDSVYPDVPAPTEIDRLVLEKLRKLEIVPSDIAADTEFLRRVSLDMTGSLPTSREIEQFLADSSPKKRAAKIDELLERPTYAAWWASRLCDLTGNNDAALNNIIPKKLQASLDWYEWINRRVAENVPYDEIVAGLLLAVSRKPDMSYEDYCKEVCAIYANNSDKTFADRETMPHFWARRTVVLPEDRALSVAYSFLGVRIQCAQCHKHPFDQWTQEDYNQFTNLFKQFRFGLRPDARKVQQTMLADLGLDKQKGGQLQRSQAELLAKGEVVPILELFVTGRSRPAATEAKAEAPKKGKKNKNKPNKPAKKPQPPAAVPKTAKLLGGSIVDLQNYDDPRQAVMDWMRDPHNPYFAKAFVNRVWTAYFNVGIVEPPDDLSLANPPSNAPLLDYLAKGFVEHKFDMKWLHREIANSRTYQLSWKPNDSNKLDERNFSHAVVRRLPAEVCYDAIQQATASDALSQRMQQTVADRAISVPGTARGNKGTPIYALTVFGRSVRETNCDCDRSNEVSLLQTVFTRNDDDVFRLIDRKRDGWLMETAAAHQFLPQTTQAVDDGERKSGAARMAKQRGQLKARIAKLQKDGNDEELKKAEVRLKQVEKRLAQMAKEKKNAVLEPVEPPVVAIKPIDFNRVISDVYLRTLSRHPSEEETRRSCEHLEKSTDKIEGLRSLLWALINTKEFIVNH